MILRESNRRRPAGLVKLCGVQPRHILSWWTAWQRVPQSGCVGGLTSASGWSQCLAAPGGGGSSEGSKTPTIHLTQLHVCRGTVHKTEPQGSRKPRDVVIHLLSVCGLPDQIDRCSFVSNERLLVMTSVRCNACIAQYDSVGYQSGAVPGRTSSDTTLKALAYRSPLLLCLEFISMLLAT